MNQQTNNSQLSPAIRSLLVGLRRRIRAYVWAEAIGALVIGVAVAFWVSLAIDWSLEPSTAARKWLLLIIASALAVVVYRVLLRKCFARMTDASMALLIERQFVDLKDSLLTTVELADRESRDEPFDREMLELVREDAARSAQEVRLRRIFDFGPLLRVSAVALLLASSLALFCAFAPNAFATWEGRMLHLETAPWPRATRLSVEGFNSGEMKVARGDDVDVVVLADISKVVPDVVTLFHQTDKTARRRVNMNRQGNATANQGALARSPHQRFSYPLKNVQETTTLEIRGGDARLRGLRILPVPPPTLTDLSLYCAFPAYLVDEETGAFDSREVPVQGSISLPLGTTVELRATANKALAAIRWQDNRQEERWQSMDVSGTKFRIPLDALNENTTISLVLTDTDGIRNRRPIQLAVSAKNDEAPNVAVELEGIGSDITPNARLPFRGKVSDEYGVTNVSFQYQKGSEESAQHSILSPSGSPTSVDIAHDEDLAGLKLQPGEEIQVSVTATDTLWQHRETRLAREKGADDTDTVLSAIDANIGRSQPYSLRVVTPERLRSILATREWTLTRRFKNQLRDMEQMRDSLERITYEASEEDNDPQKIHARRLGIVSAALRASRSARSGTRDLADDFERIVIELENNRIPTTELRPRLIDRVAVPLRSISAKPLETLIASLDAAQATVVDAQRGADDRDRAIDQSDEVLAQMNRVLKAMKASEEFNALLERFRKLSDEQTLLQKETEAARKAAERKSLELLE